jgi:hypothetical protein
MQERARESDVVARFANDLDALFDRMLANAFRGRVADEELAATVDSFRCTVAGTYAQALSPSRRRKLLTFSLRRFLD